MSYNYTERRQHQRVDVEKAIYIEVVGRGVQSEAHSNIIRCETLDVSVGGLRVWVPTPIKQGSTLNIAAPMEDWTESLELLGEAMWVREAGDREGLLGWPGTEGLQSRRHGKMVKSGLQVNVPVIVSR